jgi:FkbM family methyltransferase
MMRIGIKNFANKIDKKTPLIYIDIGAKDGISQKWNEVLDVMKIIAFEPDVREFSKLKDDGNIKYLNYAISEKTEELLLYITKGHGNSSTLKPNIPILSKFNEADRFEIIKIETIPSTRVRSLDDILEEQTILDVDFLKLDTQGSELSILKGGQKKALPMTFGIQIEVNFIELYEKGCLFRDVDGFLSDNGFSLIDIRRMFWKHKDYYDYIGKGRLIFGDALYFKDIDIFYSELSEHIKHNPNNSSFCLNKIYKGILICIIYKMFDLSMVLAQKGFDLGYFSKNEYEKVSSEIKDCSDCGLIKNSSDYKRIYDWLSKHLERHKPQSYRGWADADSDIGNIKDI